MGALPSANSGVDLNAFNPFYWVRRRSWAKQLGVKPLHRLQRPIDAAALLVVAMAKLDGDITREQKNLVLQLFKDEFHISDSEALEHYSASVHLLNGVVDIVAEVPHIFAPNREQFQPSQIKSLLKMLNAVAPAEGAINQRQTEMLQAIEANFKTNQKSEGW